MAETGTFSNSRWDSIGGSAKQELIDVINASRARYTDYNQWKSDLKGWFQSADVKGSAKWSAYADKFDDFLNEADAQALGTERATNTITPDYKKQYDTATASQDKLISNYDTWAQTMKDTVQGTNQNAFDSNAANLKNSDAVAQEAMDVGKQNIQAISEWAQKAMDDNSSLMGQSAANASNQMASTNDYNLQSKANADAQMAYSKAIEQEQKAQQDAFNAAYGKYLDQGDANYTKYAGEQDKVKAQLADKTSEYEKWAAKYRNTEGDIANRYNAKADQLQLGYIPQTFIDNEKAILQDTADTGMAALLKKFAGTGTLNSSLARQGVNDLGYGITKTMNESYKDTIDKLMGYATGQAETENTLRNADYTIGQSGYEQGFNNLKQASDLNTSTATSYGDLVKNNYSMLSDANSSIQSAIKGRYDVGNAAYDFTGQDIGNRLKASNNAYQFTADDILGRTKNTAAAYAAMQDANDSRTKNTASLYDARLKANQDYTKGINDGYTNYLKSLNDQYSMGSGIFGQQVNNAWLPMQSSAQAQDYQNNNLYKMINAINSLNTAGTNVYSGTTSTINKATGEGGTVVTQNQDNTGSILSGLGSLATAFCFPAGTMIDTPDGQKPIETLNVGDFVDTVQGPVAIKKTIQGISKTVKITTTKGAVTATPTEHFLTQRGSIPVQRMMLTDVLVRKDGLAKIQSMQSLEESKVYEIVAPWFFAEGFVIDGFDPQEVE